MRTELIRDRDLEGSWGVGGIKEISGREGKGKY